MHNSDALWRERPRARRFGAVNGRGMATFYRREVHRGFKIWGITLAAPAIRALLFAGVFALVVGNSGKIVLGIPFLEFLIPGLIAVAILERAFESAAFSMVYDKTEGIFGDLATAPLTPGELVLAYAGASVTGGLIVGAVVWLALLPLGGQVPAEPLALVYFAVAGSLIVGLFSQIAGLWALKWDYLAGVQTFIFLPFVFLSGVFFSLDQLPEALQPWARANPIFYLVDGVRFGITGRADTDPLTGVIVTLVCIIALSAFNYRLFAIGYRFKS
ncbi:MAG: ABC transporter permease [Alphaproteobacteria bacterium]|jgi:ABC-2 type transport system permease protein|nr:ABC transporter permease [Alphaproteobacteria bacterium]